MPAVKGARAARKTQPPLQNHDSAKELANQKTASSSHSSTNVMEKKNSNKNIPEPANEKTVQSDMMQVDVTDDETSGDESGENQSENEMDMVEMPNDRPMTPNAYEDMSSQKHKPVEPVSPLKADRKRGRADTVGPQKG